MKTAIVLFVALMGLGANAAAVNWNVNGIKSSPATDVAAGWLVQVFDASVEFDYEKALAGDIASWSESYVVEASTFRVSGSTTLDNGAKKDIYAVIYDAASIADAKYYIVSDIKSISANAAGSTVSASFGNMGLNNSSNKFLNSTWTAVPEPTSGLLALFGFAGLALRRRRA